MTEQPKTEMGGLEILTNTRDLLQHALGCGFTVFTGRQRDIAFRLCDTIRMCIVEREAAEKPERRPDLQDRMDNLGDWARLENKKLEDALFVANAKIELLETRLQDTRVLWSAHEHINGTSGQCYFPDETEGRKWTNPSTNL